MTQVSPEQFENGGAGRAAKMGAYAMWVLIGALAMLFLSTLAGFFFVRAGSDVWPPAGTPHLPYGLWISTFIILISSATMQFALISARSGRIQYLKSGLIATFILGTVFLIAQIMNWSSLVSQGLTPKTQNIFGFLFYLLTSLHALHVIGGLIPLGITLAKASRGVYTAEYNHPVHFMAMYWHFLGVIWYVMFAVIFVFG
jgi:cytochrome c oxidase subunit III